MKSRLAIHWRYAIFVSEEFRMFRNCRFVLPLLFLLVTCGFAQADGFEVSQWKSYRAASEPAFRMAFPGSVEVQSSKTGKTYSGQARPFDDLGVQVIVHTTRREKSAGQLDPHAALAIFTSDVDGKLTSQKVVTQKNGFVLVFSSVANEDGMVMFRLNNVHFLGKDIYDVEYFVIVSQDIGKERFTEAIQKGGEAMKRFQPG
jgi:hypothetical protein